MNRRSYPHLDETSIDSTQVYRGNLLDVRLDRIRLPSGEEATREYIRHQGAAVIVPVLDNGKLVFGRQFRYPLGQALLEFPAGKIDPGEAPENTAKRELLEETGFSSDQWRHVGVVHPCVGYSNERIEIFMARDLRRQSEQNLDHGESIDVLELHLNEALEAVRNGEITDGKTITALFWAEKILLSGW